MAHAEGEQGARDTVKKEVGTKGQYLIVSDIDPLTGCCDFIVPDRIPCQAYPRVTKSSINQKCHPNQGDGQIVEVGLEWDLQPEQADGRAEGVTSYRREGNSADPVGAPCPVEIVQQ